MTGKFLFNASNLHVGGGVQVATSVISEWACMHTFPVGLDIWASSEVDANLKAVDCNISCLPGYRVVDTHGFSTFFSSESKALQAYERVLTLFGPLYVWGMKPYSIVGFAQAWILYPQNDVARQASLVKRLLVRIKFLVQEMFFRRADRLIVELDHAAKALIARGIAQQEHVAIVYNCLGSIYSQPQRWAPIAEAPVSDRIKIGFVGRNYSHKNTTILPAVADSLVRCHGMEVEFFVTFTQAEWAICDEDFRRTVRNVGPLTVAQCPAFYQAMDAVIFPSLLECFSATPLEALAMGKPLFASERSFNRDICADYAIYFNPLDPEDAANKIAAYFKNSSDNNARVAAARQHAFSFSSAERRAKQYLDLLVPIS